MFSQSETPDSSTAVVEEFVEENPFNQSAEEAEAEAADEARRHARKIEFGTRCYTLILECEAEEAWQIVLQHWCATYNPAENSLEYEFVYRTAQADWERIRAQREYNSCRAHLGCSAFNFTAEQTKLFDRMLRYKNSAERGFQREFRLTEQFFKSHRPTPRATAKEPAFVPTPEDELPDVIFTVEDPTHPDGYRVVLECPKGRCPENPPPWVDPREPKPDEDNPPCGCTTKVRPRG
jgi:hypothetical protein